MRNEECGMRNCGELPSIEGSPSEGIASREMSLYNGVTICAAVMGAQEKGGRV